MKHNLTSGKYYDSGKEITAQQYEEGKARLQEIGRLSMAVHEGTLTIEEVPEDMKAKVTETVEIMRLPPVLEESLDETARLELENADLRKQVAALEEELELQNGGSVKPGGDIPFDPVPGKPVRPTPGGGLTIGG